MLGLDQRPPRPVEQDLPATGRPRRRTRRSNAAVCPRRRAGRVDEQQPITRPSPPPPGSRPWCAAMSAPPDTNNSVAAVVSSAPRAPARRDGVIHEGAGSITPMPIGASTLSRASGDVAVQGLGQVVHPDVAICSALPIARSSTGAVRRRSAVIGLGRSRLRSRPTKPSLTAIHRGRGQAPAASATTHGSRYRRTPGSHLGSELPHNGAKGATQEALNRQGDAASSQCELERSDF